MKKTILLILLLGFIAVSSTSCTLLAEEQQQPPAPDPIAVLEDQIVAEQNLRIEAEASAEEETLLRERWELAVIGLSVLVLVGFLAGTTIGSSGKRHASITA